MPFISVGNYNTARDGWSRWGKSIPVRVRIPPSVKETIRSIAKEKGTNASQLIRLALFSRFHIIVDDATKNHATDFSP